MALYNYGRIYGAFYLDVVIVMAPYSYGRIYEAFDRRFDPALR